MKITWLSLYLLVLSLWVGGMAIFTFLVTPAIFRSYQRDTASDIVNRLFPGYFSYNLILAVVAAALFLLTKRGWSGTARLSVILLAAALVVNLYIVFRLHPDAVQVKQQVSSFERESPDSPARRRFRTLHAISAGLNLFLLADGVVLLFAAPFLKR